jgi:septum formation protein
MDNNTQSLPLILASQSPRRKELLTEAGYTFDVCAPDDSVEKGVCSKCSPDQLVVDSAVAKAAAIARQMINARQTIDATQTIELSQSVEQESVIREQQPAIILAADTVGVCKAEVLGKPVDAEHARRMLQLMSGTVHDVLTGVCLWHLPSNQFLTFLERTTVEMDVLSEQMIDEYLDTDLWIGKAGAFGFQHGLDWVRIVKGLPSTVVGLPVERLPKWIEALLEKVA